MPYTKRLIGLLLLVTSSAAQALDPILPDAKLTPGAVRSTDPAEICHSGYSRSVRHTSGKLKRHVYAEYRINKSSGHYEVDHLVPLSIGGADRLENLWPQSRDTQPWNANVKDRLENYLHIEVCAGRIPITDAQSAISKNWIAAYEKYIGEN